MPVVLTAVGLVIIVLLLRLRLRLIISAQQRLLFFGLGRSGPEIDFVSKRGVVKIFGLRVKSFSIRGKEGDNVPREKKEEGAQDTDPGKRKPHWRDVLGVMRDSREAVWRFVRGIFRGLIVEELHGEIRAGFEQPDLTGEAYGYYYALMASVPEAHHHFRFEPDWMGPSFDGTLRVSIALPLYRFLWHFMLLLFRLPLRRIRALTIKSERGVSHA